MKGEYVICHLVVCQLIWYSNGKIGFANAAKYFWNVWNFRNWVPITQPRMRIIFTNWRVNWLFNQLQSRKVFPGISFQEFLKRRASLKYQTLRKTGLIGKRFIHIDEIALKKGHSDFETIIYTDEEILETMSGKKSIDLQSVLKDIPGIGSIQQVCIDMCAPFADAIRTALPHVEISVDRFHVVKLLNKTLDTLRRKTDRKLKTERLNLEKKLSQLKTEEAILKKELKSLQKEGIEAEKRLKKFRRKEPESNKLQRKNREQEIQTGREQLQQKKAELEKELNEIQLKERRFSHIRFLLGKDYEKLHQDDRRLVLDYLRFNPEIKEVYWLCQDFRKILFPKKVLGKEEVSTQLTEWCTKAQKQLGHFVKTLESWWTEVLNACIYPLNNGLAEGFNNKIKLVKRMGFGFRNRLNFKLRIQAACNP